jgi:hypothetical protein
MIKEETEELIMRPNAVETEFCEFLADKANVPMTQENTEMYIRFTMNPSIPVPTDEKEFEELPFQVKVLAKRFEYLNIKVDLGVILFLSMLCDRVGLLVIYATMVAYLAKKKGITDLKFEDFARLYPMGFYSEEDMKTAWDKQKIPGAMPDNLVDYASASVSIRE